MLHLHEKRKLRVLLLQDTLVVLAEWILRRWSSSTVNVNSHLEGEDDSAAPAASSACLDIAPGLHVTGEGCMHEQIISCPGPVTTNMLPSALESLLLLLAFGTVPFNTSRYKSQSVCMCISRKVRASLVLSQNTACCIWVLTRHASCCTYHILLFPQCLLLPSDLALTTRITK